MTDKGTYAPSAGAPPEGPTERFGYVRRFASTGEAWHIVDVPPTADGWAEAVSTLCGYRPLGWQSGSTWGTICAPADWMKVCTRCERVRARSAAESAPQGQEEGTGR